MGEEVTLPAKRFSATYEVTRELQDASVSQFYFRILLRPRLAGMIVGVGGLVAGAVIFPFYKAWLFGFVAAMVLFLVASWVRAYFQIRALGRAGLRIMEHPKVDLVLDEQAITYVSSTGTRCHQWSKIERLEETKDFVVLMNGKNPLLSLPKACFSEEALGFLRDRCRGGRATA